MTTDCDAMRRVLAGDVTAWGDLVQRHTPLVWAVARSHRLSRTDAADAVQNTWTALAERLPGLTTPDRLRAWLVTTARRESLRVLTRTGEECATCLEGRVFRDRDPEPKALRTARDLTLRTAFDGLPDRCRVLLTLLANAPELSHGQLAVALEMPAGSIGVTRGRCLDQLRRLLAEHDIREAG